MPGPRSHGLPSPAVCAWIVIAMLAMIVIPAVITLQTVHHPAPSIPVGPRTPRRTALYIQPSALYCSHGVHRLGWFLPSEDLHIPEAELSAGPSPYPRPSGFSAGFLLCPVVLRLSQCRRDPGLARSRAPAGRVPVEEYVFYFTGFLAVSSSVHLAGRVLAGGLQRA